MANGPMTQEDSARTDLGQLWSTLDEAVKNALVAGLRAAPEEVLGALTGGVITKIPKEFDGNVADWIVAQGDAAALVGGGGGRRLTATYTWGDPPRPDADTPFVVGMSIEGEDIADGYEVSWTVYDEAQTMLELGEDSCTGDTAQLQIPALAQGAYFLSGYLNVQGADDGDPPNAYGYRTSWGFNIRVGTPTDLPDDAYANWAGGAVSELAGSIGAGRTAGDLTELLGAVAADLEPLALTGEGAVAFLGAAPGWGTEQPDAALPDGFAADLSTAIALAAGQLATATGVVDEDLVMDAAFATAAEVLGRPLAEA